MGAETGSQFHRSCSNQVEDDKHLDELTGEEGVDAPAASLEESAGGGQEGERRWDIKSGVLWRPSQRHSDVVSAEGRVRTGQNRNMSSVSTGLSFSWRLDIDSEVSARSSGAFQNQRASSALQKRTFLYPESE